MRDYLELTKPRITLLILICIVGQASWPALRRPKSLIRRGN